MEGCFEIILPSPTGNCSSGSSSFSSTSSPPPTPPPVPAPPPAPRSCDCGAIDGVLATARMLAGSTHGAQLLTVIAMRARRLTHAGGSLDVSSRHSPSAHQGLTPALPEPQLQALGPTSVI